MSDNELICPDCKTVVTRNYGLPGVVCNCPKCGKVWVKMLGKLVSLEEFHARAALEP